MNFIILFHRNIPVIFIITSVVFCVYNSSLCVEFLDNEQMEGNVFYMRN
jgi:hypothetical protein